MPRYVWLIKNQLNTSSIKQKISALRTIGVPYPDGFENEAMADMQRQADGIVANLKAATIEVEADREIVALIAYLQRLGTDSRQELQAEVAP